MLKEGQMRIPSGCAISGIFARDGRRMSGEAIIRSMTPKERRHPDIINGSRRKRIAAGCGMRVQDVNKLLKNFEESKKMMKKMQGMAKFASKGGFKMPFMNK